MLVPGAAFDAADVLLQGVPDGGAGGQPVRQPGADQRIGVEQAEFTAELAVVGHGSWGLLAVRERVTTTAKPRGTRPGASDG